MKIKINTSFRYLDLDKAYTARSQGISSGVSVLFLGSLRGPSAIPLAKLHRLIVEVADYLLLTVDLQLMRWGKFVRWRNDERNSTDGRF
jgi:hypothetical protein